MEYHLDTIPVIDALNEDDECLLCAVERKTDKLYTEAFLGGSVMAPETRVQVNEHGFCPKHFHQLYDQKNRLGLALMTHTYMRETVRQMQKKEKSFPLKVKRKLFADKKSDAYKQYDDFCKWIEAKHDDCMVCKKVNEAMNRYTYTMLYLYKTNEEFRNKLGASRGLCIHHLRKSVEMAENSYNTAFASDWLKFIMPVEYKAFERLDGELDWYIKKFDYRFREEPWGTSQDSLVRSLQKMVGDKFD